MLQSQSQSAWLVSCFNQFTAWDFNWIALYAREYVRSRILSNDKNFVNKILTGLNKHFSAKIILHILCNGTFIYDIQHGL